MNKNFAKIKKLVLLTLVFFITASLVFRALNAEDKPYVPFSEFMTRVDAGQVASVEIKGENITFITDDATEQTTIRPVGEDIVNRLLNAKVMVDVKSQSPSLFVSILISFVPIILMVVLFVILMRFMTGSMGKSKAKLMQEDKTPVKFEDVAGINEAKAELQEIVDFLKKPEKFTALGGKIPRGALLIGPPGTGKTLLARAVAGEAGVPFFSISGSDFVEMFVGVGAKRVRAMFEEAKKKAPCIIFIDEIDAVGRARGKGIGGGNDEREQTLNQLLVEMDGFSDNQGVIVIAATNRKDVLDPALLRAGRFDRQVFVGNPDVRGRAKILQVHARKVPLAADVDMDVIARGTPGFSGADLMNLMNESALLAVRRDHERVTMKDLEDAKDKVMMGVERLEMGLTDEQKRKTAYHEAGHAIVGRHMPKCDPVYKATIIPRGMSLGMVVSLPEIDKLNHHKDEVTQKIAMTMAGKAAEVIVYGEEGVSNGPASDIQQASALARAMVMRWGMSDKVGPVDYSEAHDGYTGGSTGLSVSAETKTIIEAEVRRIIEEGYAKALKVLTENAEEFENLAQGLLKYETLSGDEISRVVKGLPPREDAVVGLAKEPTAVPPSISLPLPIAAAMGKD